MQLFLWRHRKVLAEQFKRNVPIGILVTFDGGFGLGLLVASAFSLCSRDEQSRLATLPWCSVTLAGRTAFSPKRSLGFSTLEPSAPGPRLAMLAGRTVFGGPFDYT